jgi:hypothetical protein
MLKTTEKVGIIICVLIIVYIVGEIKTSRRVKTASIRTNTNFSDLSGEYHLTEDATLLLKDYNLTLPQRIKVNGGNTGQLTIYSEWYSYSRKRKIDITFQDVVSALDFINEKPSNIIYLSFEYCKVDDLDDTCIKSKNQITLDDNVIKIHMGDTRPPIIYTRL